MKFSKDDKKEIRKAERLMDRIVANWFADDPVMLGTWCLVDKVPDPKQKVMGISCKSRPPSIKYNPYFITSLNYEQLETVMASEGFKLLLRHPTTRLKKPQNISSLASQITVNQSIMNNIFDEKDEDYFVMPNQFGLKPNKWYENYFKSLNDMNEKLKDILKEIFKNMKPQQGEGQEQGAGNEDPRQGTGSGKPNDTDGQDKGQGTGFEKFDNKKEAMENYMNPDGTSNQEWDVNDLLDADIKNMVEEKRHSTKNWGKFTDHAMGDIIAANKPKISYKDIIRRFNVSILSSKSLASRMKVNRRYDLDSPGSRRIYKSRLLFAIDTSGSMSDDDIQEGLCVVNSLCRHSQIVYMMFDWEIQCVETKFKRARKTFKVMGRGGTNFHPVCEYAQKERIDGLIIYTDGMAQAPPKPKNTKVLWLMTNKDLRPPVEWGMVACLDRYEDAH